LEGNFPAAAQKPRTLVKEGNMVSKLRFFVKFWRYGKNASLRRAWRLTVLMDDFCRCALPQPRLAMQEAPVYGRREIH
jgi:hypothetical protein